MRKKYKKSTRGQEEMVGFALIIIIVAVILLVFLSLTIKKPEKGIESYEVESFIQAFLQHTSDCRDSGNQEYLSVQDLIFDCDDNENCLDGRNTCEVLDSTLTKIIEKSWKSDNKIKGYELNISSDYNQIFYFEDGNKTKNYKTPGQDFSRGGIEGYDIIFKAYF